TGDADMGKYELTSRVYSRTNRSISYSQDLCFIVFRNYSMEVKNFTVFRKQVEPGQEVSGNLVVRNTGSRRFENINVSFRLGIGEKTFNHERTTFALGLDERRTVKFSLRIPEHLDPGNYEIMYDVKARGSTFSIEGKSVEVVSVEEARINESSGTNILTGTHDLVVTNTGNVEYTEPVTRVVSDPFSLLVTSDSDKVRRVSGGYEYIWNTQLDPGESMRVSYTVHYWPLYIMALVLLFLIYRTFVYLRVPKIEKKIKRTELREDEKVFTVSLEVKNRLLGKAEDVRIIDSVPSVARVIDDFDTVKPDMTESEDGTELRWNIGSMDSGEERILHYKIKTLVQAVDHLKLPRARTEGKMKDKRFERESSKVKLEV
ncbi:MAG: NEW3 domain-containing protein, partial [Candidatus Aenigmatarchaeota archaeon]